MSCSFFVRLLGLITTGLMLAFTSTSCSLLAEVSQQKVSRRAAPVKCQAASVRPGLPQQRVSGRTIRPAELVAYAGPGISTARYCLQAL